jgi:hypothetical protein
MKAMKHLFVIFSLMLTFLTVGCGGGGGGIGFNVIDNWVGDASGAIERQDLSRISNLIDRDYFDNCVTKNQLVNDYADIFSDPDIRDIDVRTIDISNRFVNEVNGTASFFWTEEWRVTYSDGFVETTRASGFVYLIRSGGVWREYGNQECPRTTGGEAPKPLKGLKPTRVSN